MKKIFICLSICIFSLSVILTNAYAAESFSDSESLSEKLKKYTDEEESWWDVDETVKYKITAKVSLNGIDINKITEETYFSMYFGELEFGDNLTISSGKKSLVLSDMCNVVKLKWDKNYLNATLASLCKYRTILTENYYGETGPVNETETAEIYLGDESFELDAFFDVKVTGKVSEKTVTKDEEDFELETINLKGKASVQNR